MPAGHTLGLAEHVVEVITPRTNAALLSPAEHFFAAVTLHASMDDGGPIALEIVADATCRRFLMRAGTIDAQRRAAAQLGAAYPQAELRHLGARAFLVADPARPDPDEQIAACTLRLRKPEYLPLRTLQDREVSASSGSEQADPLLGVLNAVSDLPTGWRALAQLVVLAAATPDWARAHQRLALEDPLRYERGNGAGRGSLFGPAGVIGLLLLYLVCSSAVSAWAAGDWLVTLGLVGGALLLAVGAVAVARRLARHELIDPRLVQDKLGHDACEVELRLAVFAPGFVDPAAVEARLQRLAAAYRPFSLPAGNGLLPAPVRDDSPDLRVLAPLGRPCRLNVRELAGLWHLVQAADDVAFVERTTARRRLPLPATVAADKTGDGCRIGVSAHHGRAVPVYLPDGLLRRHLLAVAKTRRGKSSLLLKLTEHLMHGGTGPASGQSAGQRKRCVVLVDPHRDLAVAALGLVPPERRSDIVYLDLSNRRRPFGLNLLDVGLGWDRDQAVSNTLRIFRREFDGFWGPRMEDAFRFALMALFEANEAVCRADPRWGRLSQYTVLEVPALLALRGFRRRVLKQTTDPSIGRWFEDYFDALDPRLRLEIINPVQTKVHRYLGSQVARQIVGQPRSTIDFQQFVTDKKVVLVNLNAFDVGEDTAALIGGTLLNLAARAVSAQASVPPEDRQPVTMIVDEFHMIPGADYEQICGELAKYGANLVLATQTLARLDRLTIAQQPRDLRAAVFSNLDGLFAFHTSAEDARYLADELGGGLDEQDLLELGQYQCYARITDVRTGERIPSFSVQLDLPPVGDRQLSADLALESAGRYGRDAIEVDLDRQTALARVDGGRRRGIDGAEAELTLGTVHGQTPGTGLPAPDRTVVGGELPHPVQYRTVQKRGKKNGKRAGSSATDRSEASDIRSRATDIHVTRNQ